MAVVRLSSRPFVVAMSLVLLLNVLIFSQVGVSKSIGQNGSGEDIDSTNWREIWKSVVGGEDDIDTVFRKLNELKALFDKYEVPENLLDYKNQFDQLIKLESKDTELCTSSYITNLAQGVQAKGDNSLHEYMRHHGNELLSICTGLIVRDTEKALSEIEKSVPKQTGSNYGNLLSKLREKVRIAIERRPKKRDFELNYRQEYIEAINQFLNLFKASAILLSRDQKLSGSIWYKDFILEPCKLWLTATDSLRRVYPYLIQDEISEHLKRRLDEADVCEYIITNSNEFEKHVV